MSAESRSRVVFKLTDVPLLESPDGTMRDSVMVTSETCGAQQYTAGLFWVRPSGRGHADKHPGLEEIYYIIEGRGTVVIDDRPHAIEAGDVVHIPDGSTHYLANDGHEPLGLFWAIPRSWNDLPSIQRELGRWRSVDPDTEFGTRQ